MTGSWAFQVPTTPSTTRHAATSTTLTATQVDVNDVETARTAFYIWFFGASGAAGIARGAFPRMYNNVVQTQALKDVEPMGSGETLGISPLVGYPRDLYVNDVQQVLKNVKSVEGLVNKYPVDNNMWSKSGYLTWSAFEQANAANKKTNPLAVRAVMDALAQSGDVVDPDNAQDKLNAYQQDLNLFKADLLKNKLVGYSSIAVLLFLLGLGDVVAAGHAYHGWFPDWPGAQGFPWTLLDAEKGLSSIPQYWI
uniref:Uncharacterized protein n=1 Tax=Entomoneis paludosa TaxID=265537 RepID=A0A7S2YB91_9STRA|mmetsp:Transcript_25796/g.53782  ORF Transcript_25796/g.53782 Transcript_25796/m.53782 type:complete len:252 (+) Transcript_25796:1-756(+)